MLPQVKMSIWFSKFEDSRTCSVCSYLQFTSYGLPGMLGFLSLDALILGIHGLDTSGGFNF